MTDVFLVTRDNYPSIFKAFELISHDCGRQAGHLNYAIPIVPYIDVIQIIENCLKHLIDTADLDFECLCIGEQLESQAVVHKYGYVLTDELLQRFFEEFQ